MRVVQVNDDISPEALYPEKRRYFSLFFIGYPRVFHPNKEALEHVKKTSSISNAAVMWTASDTDTDFSLIPFLWSAQIGRLVSSNKKCFFGSPIPSPYRPISKIVGYDNWYNFLPKLCEDLAVVIRNELIENVTIESKINARAGVR